MVYATGTSNKHRLNLGCYNHLLLLMTPACSAEVYCLLFACLVLGDGDGTMGQGRTAVASSKGSVAESSHASESSSLQSTQLTRLRAAVPPFWDSLHAQLLVVLTR